MARKRSHEIKVRLDDDELKNFVARLEKYHLSRQHFLRTCAMGIPVVPPEYLRQIYTELHHQGVNINQIAKALNSKSDCSDEHIHQIKEAQKVWQQLNQLLRKRL